MDIASAAAIGTSLKTAGDIAKAAIGLRDAEAMRAKVIELQGVILTAQSSAMTAQSDQFALLEQVRALKGQIADLEAWSATKQRYELYEWELGSFSYRLKEGVQPPEPTHHICANCYKQGHASILQTAKGGMYNKALHCDRCSSTIFTLRVTPPPVRYSGRVTRV